MVRLDAITSGNCLPSVSNRRLHFSASSSEFVGGFRTKGLLRSGILGFFRAFLGSTIRDANSDESCLGCLRWLWASYSAILASKRPKTRNPAVSQSFICPVIPKKSNPKPPTTQIFTHRFCRRPLIIGIVGLISMVGQSVVTFARKSRE